MKPGMENTIRFIKWELHNLEREDFLKVKNSYSYKNQEIERKMKSSNNFSNKQDLETFSLQKGISMGDAGNLFSMETKNGEDIIF